MREAENILSLESLAIDMMGFIFYEKSPRYIASRPSIMPSQASRVGVFVNEKADVIERRIKEFELDYVQLHGSESVEDCLRVAQCGVKVIKAFSVGEDFYFGLTDGFSSVCELFIFDTKCSGHGGSGVSFDWELLRGYRGATPFLLSGGISLDNVEAVRQFSHPRLAGYDLNSCFELSPGVKSKELLTNFLEQLKL